MKLREEQASIVSEGKLCNVHLTIIASSTDGILDDLERTTLNNSVNMELLIGMWALVGHRESVCSVY
jgi:hypothetical protein